MFQHAEFVGRHFNRLLTNTVISFPPSHTGTIDALSCASHGILQLILVRCLIYTFTCQYLLMFVSSTLIGSGVKLKTNTILHLPRGGMDEEDSGKTIHNNQTEGVGHRRGEPAAITKKGGGGGRPRSCRDCHESSSSSPITTRFLQRKRRSTLLLDYNL